ncbi:MAG: response regulator transcription factor [Saprospiraceae bacterium]|nr:response regulator transcription factor [Saprospiraceae bacterium]
MKILIFDEHPVMSDALFKFFFHKKDIKLVLNEQNILKFYGSLKKYSPDIVIIDIPSENNGGISILSKIRKLNSTVKIIVYSRISNPLMHDWILKYGANAFISKTSNLSKLEKLIETTFKNEINQITYQLMPYLTPKEKVIIQKMSLGYTSYEIATQTNKSINTINNQKKHLLSKFHCSNSIELMLKLINLGML